MVTYDGNVVLLDNGLCLWHNARESAEICGTNYLDLHRMDTLVTIR